MARLDLVQMIILILMKAESSLKLDVEVFLVIQASLRLSENPGMLGFLLAARSESRYS